MGKTVVSERVLVEAHKSPREALRVVAGAVEDMIGRYERADVALDVSSLTVVPEDHPGWLSITMDGRTKD